MVLLSSTISPELLMVMQLDESFAQRWRDRDFVHIYCLAHQAAVNDFQLSAHADIMSLLRLKMVDDGYLEFCHEFNQIWEKLESDYPDPVELLDRILSGKVVSDCACTLSRLQGSVNAVLGNGEELPGHEDLMKKFGEELRNLEVFDKVDAIRNTWSGSPIAVGGEGGHRQAQSEGSNSRRASGRIAVGRPCRAADDGRGRVGGSHGDDIRANIGVGGSEPRGTVKGNIEENDAPGLRYLHPHASCDVSLNDPDAPIPKHAIPVMLDFENWNEWEPQARSVIRKCSPACIDWLNTRKRPDYSLREIFSEQVDKEGQPLLHPSDYDIVELRGEPVRYLRKEYDVFGRSDIVMETLEESERQCILNRIVDAKKLARRRQEDFDRGRGAALGDLILTLSEGVRAAMTSLYDLKSLDRN